MDLVVLELAKQHTEETAIGLGAVKGANCTVSTSPILDAEGNETANKVTFNWEANDGTQETSDIIVKNGKGLDPFVFTQATLSNVWNIQHGLNNQYPEVLCLDDTGGEIYGKINYFSANLTIIEFCTAVKGKAILK